MHIDSIDSNSDSRKLMESQPAIEASQKVEGPDNKKGVQASDAIDHEKAQSEKKTPSQIVDEVLRRMDEVEGGMRNEYAGQVSKRIEEEQRAEARRDEEYNDALRKEENESFSEKVVRKNDKDDDLKQESQQFHENDEKRQDDMRSTVMSDGDDVIYKQGGFYTDNVYAASANLGKTAQDNTNQNTHLSA